MVNFNQISQNQQKVFESGSTKLRSEGNKYHWDGSFKRVMYNLCPVYNLSLSPLFKVFKVLFLTITQ